MLSPCAIGTVDFEASAANDTSSILKSLAEMAKPNTSAVTAAQFNPTVPDLGSTFRLGRLSDA